MASDTDNMSSETGESTEQTASKLENVADSVKPSVDRVSPEQRELLKTGAKLGFTVALIALLLYWGAAYQLEIQLFEF